MSGIPQHLNTIVVTCNDWTLKEIQPLLAYLRYCGNIGHSVHFNIDDKHFSFDGDGASRLIDMIINGESWDRSWLESRIRELQRKLDAFTAEFPNGSGKVETTDNTSGV